MPKLKNVTQKEFSEAVEEANKLSSRLGGMKHRIEQGYADELEDLREGYWAFFNLLGTSLEILRFLESKRDLKEQEITLRAKLRKQLKNAKKRM